MKTSKADTMFSEKERLVFMRHLDTFNLNPFSFWGLLKSYIEHCYPMPAYIQYSAPKKDKKESKAGKSKEVELWLQTAGYVGKRKANLQKLDMIHARLFCLSYYQNLRPYPVSFQVMNAIEVHLRTPGVTDSEIINPMREIYNPTEERIVSKAGRSKLNLLK